MIVDSLSEYNRNLYYQQQQPYQPPVIPATQEAADELQGRNIKPMKPTAVGAKNHVVGFRTDDDRYTFFVNVAEMMFREGIIKNNSVSTLLQHAAFDVCNMYLFDLMNRVRKKQVEEQTQMGQGQGPTRSPYYHIEEPDPEPQSEPIF